MTDHPGDTRQNSAFPITIGTMILLALVHFVTRSNINTASFVLSQFSLIPQQVFVGEWWRLLSACFLHANLSHLGSNVFGLFIFGRLLEPVIGPRATILLLFTSGVLGNLLSCFLMPPDSFSIGASGMAYGLTGAYIALSVVLQKKLDQLQPLAAQKSKQQLRGAIILLVVFILMHSQQPNLNLWAHLGGLATGVLFAVLWCQRLSRQKAIVRQSESAEIFE